MASILKVDTITGVTTAGSIAITGESNATTTNLQQGLAKAWANIDGSGDVSFQDSFNTSGLTATGTGDSPTSVSTSFGKANYSFTYCGASDGAETTYQMKSASMAVGTHQIQLKNAAGTVTDRNFICGTFLGDLA